MALVSHRRMLIHAVICTKTFTMTDCEAAKYFDKFKLVPREMVCKSSRNSLPTNAIQNGAQLGISANTEDLNPLKLLKLQENSDLS